MFSFKYQLKFSFLKFYFKTSIIKLINDHISNSHIKISKPSAMRPTAKFWSNCPSLGDFFPSLRSDISTIYQTSSQNIYFIYIYIKGSNLKSLVEHDSVGWFMCVLLWIAIIDHDWSNFRYTLNEHLLVFVDLSFICEFFFVKINYYPILLGK